MQINAATAAILLALAAGGFLASIPARAEEKPASDPEAPARARLRPICADKTVRDKLVAEIVKRGGEYERATAKWDLDVACEQIDLPANPVHDTADPADGASHTSWIYDARWSPDGKRIATAGRDGSVRLWDVATGRTVRKIDITQLPRLKPGSKTGMPSLMPGLASDNPGYVRAARFLGDGRQIVVAADTHPVRIFDAASGEPVAEVPYAQPDPRWTVAPVIATTTKGLILLLGYGGDLVVYDAKEKAERYRLPGIPDHIPTLAVSEAAGFLATTAPGKGRSVIVQVRKIENGELLWQAAAEGDRSAYSMAFSRDGKQLAVAVEGQVYVYATADRKLVNKLLVYPTFGHFEIAFAADGQRLISSAQRHPQLWDMATGRRIHHFGPFSDLCHSVDVSPDGKYLVTSHMGSDGRIWEIATGTFHRRLGQNIRPRG